MRRQSSECTGSRAERQSHIRLRDFGLVRRLQHAMGSRCVRRIAQITECRHRRCAGALENVRDVQTIVRAEVARNYIEMRAAEDQIAIARANIDSEKEMLDLIRIRADAGLAS